ncbi:MAG: FAD-binding domain-containing protein, partial [Pseudomonadota bacterium]
MQIVWFKRDLRAADHRPLAQAAACGPVLPIYVIEPDLWRAPSASLRQAAFVKDALQSLAQDLGAAGAPLHIRHGRVVDVLSDLRQAFGAFRLWSHQETGDAQTFARDRDVAAWAGAHGVEWREVQPAGVIRRLKSRNGWAAKWDRLMAEPVTPVPNLRPAAREAAAEWGTWASLVRPEACQHGHRQAGLDLLHSFLETRGQNYRREMSSPVTAFDACSRLSPHLAWGTLSTREVTQTAQAALSNARARGGRDGWVGSLNSFLGRLHWRCHFMQKLEDEPEIEFHTMHRSFDTVRADGNDPKLLDAWSRGETGYPMVDACMRALATTGYLNFRMRAMVTSFAAYHLWLDWRVFGPKLAHLFTDYEPGIHFSQLQMQSGVTGINTPRIYNPVKQSLDHDPEGVFLKRWLPELAGLSAEDIHSPWTLAPGAVKAAGVTLGETYPRPVIDLAEAG